MTEREVVIVDGTRTAFGRMGGTLKDIIASKLGGIGIKGLLEKTEIKEKAHVDCVFLGSATGCSHSGNPARYAVLDSGLGYETSASYVEMQCGSAIDSINHAAWKILANHAEIVIAEQHLCCKFHRFRFHVKIKGSLNLGRDRVDDSAVCAVLKREAEENVVDEAAVRETE